MKIEKTPILIVVCMGIYNVKLYMKMKLYFFFIELQPGDYDGH